MTRYDHQRVYAISLEDCQALSERLRVGMSIITFNADRLRDICYTFIDLHERYRKRTSFRSKMSAEESSFPSSLMAVALEFFLQMDGNSDSFRLLVCDEVVCCSVDVFFMKTCSYRGAEPRSTVEGLFSDDEEPNERHQMSPCGEQSCLCCHPLNHEKRRYRWLVVDFQSSAKDQFYKNYVSYLNAPAVSEMFDHRSLIGSEIHFVETCATKNII